MECPKAKHRLQLHKQRWGRDGVRQGRSHVPVDDAEEHRVLNTCGHQPGRRFLRTQRKRVPGTPRSLCREELTRPLPGNETLGSGSNPL